MNTAACCTLLTLATALPLQPTPARQSPITLNPGRAHIWIGTTGGVGYLTPPELRLYATRALTGRPAMRLDRRGVTLDEQLICAWPAGALDLASRAYGAPLVSARDPLAPCPSDLPIRSFASAERPFSIYVEIAQLNGSIVEVDYRGRRYFLSLQSLPGDPWTGSGGSLVERPQSSPRPLLGGVDVPAAFSANPTGRRFAVPLYPAPRRDSQTIATLSRPEYFENFSLGAGAHVADVYARSEGWYLLRLIDGRFGWLAPGDAGKFVSYERLLHNGDTHLTDAWDRTLARQPGDVDRIPAPPDPRRAWIGYLVPRTRPFDTVPVFSIPDRTSPMIGVFDSGDDWYSLARVDPPQLEGDAPIVFSRRPGWLEVASERENDSYRPEGMKRGWVEDDPVRWDVRPVDVAQREQLLTDAWGPEALPAVDVVDTRRVGQTLWLHVRVFVGEVCENALSIDQRRQVLAEGWVPAHGTAGRPTVWYETYCD